MKIKKHITFIILVMIMGSFVTSCTENSRAKNFGGTATINVPCGMMVGNITWKDANLWYSYIPMPEGYAPVTHTFQEESSFGVMQGTYQLVESKCE